MNTLNIITGDDINQLVQLTRNGVDFAILNSDQVQCAIVSFDRKTILVTAVVQDDTATGANWGESIIACEFTNALTNQITKTGQAWLEIQVTQASKITTWFVMVNIIQGNI
jgi:hypothetical protein